MGSEPVPQGAVAPRELTGEEAALYDRQIRLWGLEAQRKLGSSHVLVAGGACSLLGHEVAKNVVLAGVARLGLCAAGSALSPGFLGADVAATAAALREMNPHVDVVVLDEVVPHVAEFSAVCTVGMRREDELAIAKACRAHGVALMAGHVSGLVGWVFLDLGPCYTFQVKVNSDQKDVKSESDTMTDRQSMFCSYADAIAAPWGKESPRSEFGWHVASTLLEFEGQHGRLPSGEKDSQVLLQLYERLCAEKSCTNSKKELVEQAGSASQYVIAPIAAIVGGMWGREIIKFVSGKDQPLNNFFFFNSKTSVGSVERVGPQA